MTKLKERTGSSKKMRETGTTGVIDQIDLGLTSVFDVGAIQGFKSPELAVARTTQTVAAFCWLSKRGIKNHLLVRQNDTTLRVAEAEISGVALLSGEAVADGIDLEVLFRLRASKKFVDRVAKGQVEFDPEVYLRDGDKLKEGVQFKAPFIEVTTKREDLDGYLTPEQACEVSGLTPEELHKLFAWAEKIGMYLEELYATIGFTLIDGKIEASRLRVTGEFILMDGISLDELGVVKDDQHYGKNLLRDWYKRYCPEWYAELQAAQARWPNDKSKWPPCPPLARWVEMEHVQHYIEVAPLLAEAVKKLAAA